jgi:hypothetical protein
MGIEGQRKDQNSSRKVVSFWECTLGSAPRIQNLGKERMTVDSLASGRCLVDTSPV